MTEPGVTFATLAEDAEDRLQPLRRALGVTALGINQVILAPGQRMRVHLHERQEEVYLVLEGELTLVVEGTPHVLGPQRLARVGPGVRRQLVNAGTAPVRVLALGAAGEHDGRDALTWTSWDEGGPGGQPRDVPLPPDLPSG